MSTASEIVMTNTLAFLFPEKAAQPTMADIARFGKSLKSDQSKMDAAYKISDENSVFIRFKCEDAMMYTLENNKEELPFHYTNGKRVIVRMSIAGKNTRNVRVSDQPPEITEQPTKQCELELLEKEPDPAATGTAEWINGNENDPSSS